MTTDTTVKPGQIWADNDKRAEGRTVRVERIEDGKAVCTILTNRDATQRDLDRGSAWVNDMRGRTTRIALSRFKPTNTGYRLVQDEGR
jgi:ABC-type phosphate transport system auxiliary subunit